MITADGLTRRFGSLLAALIAPSGGTATVAGFHLGSENRATRQRAALSFSWARPFLASSQRFCSIRGCATYQFSSLAILPGIIPLIIYSSRKALVSLWLVGLEGIVLYFAMKVFSREQILTRWR